MFRLKRGTTSYDVIKISIKDAFITNKLPNSNRELKNMVNLKLGKNQVIKSAYLTAGNVLELDIYATGEEMVGERFITLFMKSPEEPFESWLFDMEVINIGRVKLTGGVIKSLFLVDYDCNYGDVIPEMENRYEITYGLDLAESDDNTVLCDFNTDNRALFRDDDESDELDEVCEAGDSYALEIHEKLDLLNTKLDAIASIFKKPANNEAGEDKKAKDSEVVVRPNIMSPYYTYLRETKEFKLTTVGVSIPEGMSLLRLDVFIKPECLESYDQNIKNLLNQFVHRPFGLSVVKQNNNTILALNNIVVATFDDPNCFTLKEIEDYLTIDCLYDFIKKHFGIGNQMYPRPQPYFNNQYEVPFVGDMYDAMSKHNNIYKPVDLKEKR